MQKTCCNLRTVVASWIVLWVVFVATAHAVFAEQGNSLNQTIKTPQCSRLLRSRSQIVIQSAVHLSRVQVNTLLAEWKSSPSARARKALQEKLFLAHVRLLAKVASRYSQMNPSLEFDDLFQAGAAQFSRALEKYQPEKANFLTYVWHWYEHGVIRYVVNQLIRFRSAVSRRLLENYFRAVGDMNRRLTQEGKPFTAENLANAFNQRTFDRFEQRHGRTPTAEEILILSKQNKAIITAEEAAAADAAISEFRQQAQVSPADLADLVLGEQLSADEQIEEVEFSVATSALLARFRNTLKTDRARAIFDYRIVADPSEQMSLEALAKMQTPAVSHQAISKTESRMRLNLKRFLEENGIDQLRSR